MVQEKAVQHFVASAQSATPDEIRKAQARLISFLGKSERPMLAGERINDETIKATYDALAVMLQEQDAGCLHCLFGGLDKSDRCQHA